MIVKLRNHSPPGLSSLPQPRERHEASTCKRYGVGLLLPWTELLPLVKRLDRYETPAAGKGIAISRLGVPLSPLSR
jgi:hypothetical protein